jgi:hypothetical protein
MTRQDVTAKVAKLMAVARSTNNPHEASSARRQADKLIVEHNLNVTELDAEAQASAYDDLVDKIQSHVDQNAHMGGLLAHHTELIKEVTQRVKSAKLTDKASRLRMLVKGIRTASLFLNHPVLNELKLTVEKTLNDHNITL